MCDKIDFKRQLDTYRAQRYKFRLVQVPSTRYLMIDGRGDPNTAPAYGQALQALYPVAYKMKFHSKRELGRDYVVPPLEGLWWAQDMTVFTSARDKTRWEWTMMIMVPEWIDQTVFDVAVAHAGKKNPPDRLDDVRVDWLSEGLCAQTLHIGPFDDEAAVLEQMHHEFIPGQQLQMAGTHHEVYFTDPRKTVPERLRTLLRQPVRHN